MHQDAAPLDARQAAAGARTALTVRNRRSEQKGEDHQSFSKRHGGGCIGRRTKTRMYSPAAKGTCLNNVRQNSCSTYKSSDDGITCE